METSPSYSGSKANHAQTVKHAKNAAASTSGAEPRSKSSNSLVKKPSQRDMVLWKALSSQNLPAVLNDPNRGKQRDFFTKLWGDDFVESAFIGNLEHLPEVSSANFEHYLRKIRKRLRLHERLNHSINGGPLSPKWPVSVPDRAQSDMSVVPKIFIQPQFDLRVPETFNTIHSLKGDTHKSKPISSANQLQEKLAHYLDIVEVQIAFQVTQKSDTFFQAMSSHDTLMEKLSKTCLTVSLLRSKLQNIDQHLVKDSLKILRYAQTKQNYLAVVEKLKLMVTVHQTQSMLQLLLSIPDYVAAIDLILTTQEILVQELAGVHGFRHLSSQLSEMQRLIDKILSAEFERYVTADLNRPLDLYTEVLEEDKLASIVYGMLRQKYFNFANKYKEEAFTSIKAKVKQLVIEEIAASDSGEGDVRLTGSGEQLQGLPLTRWQHLLQRTAETLLKIVHHVKVVHDVMREAVEKSSGKDKLKEDENNTSSNYLNISDPSETLLSPDERVVVEFCLSELLCSVCDYANDQFAQLLTSQSKETWIERATATQVCDVAKVVDNFVVSCEQVCGKCSTALKSAFKVQASKFVSKFHQDQKDKLTLILASETWKQAMVPQEFQNLANKLHETGKLSLPKRELGSTIPNGGLSLTGAPSLVIGGENYVVVGSILLLLKMMAEYCLCAEELTVMAPNLLRCLIELLQLFNSRSCQLVLGAGALHSVGLNTITSTNLALMSRSLQLVLVAAEAAKQQLLPSVVEPQRIEMHIENLERDIMSHCREIENKLLALIGGLLSREICQWDAKPPVPSNSFRNVSKHMKKLYEAISEVLPEKQVQNLYRSAHKMFKIVLKEQLVKMNILNNGGPQHGVVISELTFYLDALRRLKVMPIDELMMDSMEDIWDR
ncbi:vacuolar protein sorting-associated protein 54 [Neocloeon triangulifer]|uniref:vacuolar protein sorting-associated protein 54 n=1 Tax=Neocloeon triangulifer TaxID=2078957 RepID=UPI00286EF495|nr:vacuolar protein sorting-associated protein 54 [Neocloeon triangulifer]XP_059476715.1 vacuolar protein sorting-associated protein 54 [Neocloeon triangulifer]XP_059476717.1 vacuolar protein sorting-associated protein 54 [Neocloeon triangulifer]